MRLRRKAADDYGIHDKNNGPNHEHAFVKIIEKKGTLDESLLLQESFAPGVKGKLKPTKAAIQGLIGSIPTAIRGHPHRQDALALEADPRRSPEAARRRPGAGEEASTSTPRSTARSSTSTSQGEEEIEPEPDEVEAEA